MQNPDNVAMQRIKKSQNSPPFAKKLALVGCFLSLPLLTFCQEKTIIDCKDCKTLNEVKVFGFSPERFMSGLKVQRIDSINLARFQYQNLSDFLQFQTPIALKSYGSGQLTTISFRGTSANHTAVLWNGLNINSPTVGLTDFSTIPLLGFDQMAIQYGSSASCVGSDAVGGSILLSSVPNLTNKGSNVVFGGQYGSFRSGNVNAGIRFHKALKKGILSGKTLFYGGTNRNYFGYYPALNVVKTDRNGREYAIEPSQTIQKGFVQDLYFKLNTQSKANYQLVYLNIWLTDNKLTIQPTIPDFREVTQTQAYRLIAGIQIENTSLKLGFIRDILDYGKGNFINSSNASTDRIIVRTEHDFFTNKNKANTTLRIGGELIHYATKVDGYGNNLIQENRGDLYALIRKSFGWNGNANRISTSLNLRQAFSTLYKAPFTPAIGFDYNLITNKTSQLILTSNVSRSYRLPTLNERYWLVLGNPNIQPENGLNKEIGLEYKYQHGQFYKSSIALNGFHNLIDNWTYWNPERNYRVENLQQVLSKGLELTSYLKFNDFLTQQMAGILFSYSLTHASQQKVYDIYAHDFIGKQLIYVPRHAISANLYYRKKRWNVGLQSSYNSARFITFDHSGQPFPPYLIINSTFSRKINFAHNEVNLTFQANNLTNTTYPNVKKNAMPGINFHLALLINFTNN
ncbi:Vitamin B12 transporter BtuB [Emticicia aquatica]|uniref:Vitamin B12 transporter BtuB n=1 Tax=Emticicia aquatica TaxID=1681835 RepID=A0ABN8ETL5_9BACT|nr:TonB-dependent receptor plug domain-containing protein [Emticicia aquatica]CAH0994939.1 Vitamin B12 transporter BtuB [Emticicia aquatica]